jgi:hypothetical protein
MRPEIFNMWVIAGRIPCRHQQQFSINVWAGIVGDYLVGPLVLPHRPTGNHYRKFLLHVLPNLLEAVTPAVRTRMWYMHEAAPTHFSLSVRDVHNNTYHDRWKGTGNSSAWPQRKPDFNPLEYHIKYHTLPFRIVLENKFLQAVIILTCIPEMSSSDLDRESGNCDWGFSWFYSVFGDCQYSTLN